MERSNNPRPRINTRGLVDIFDNVLEPHVAELIDMEVRSKNFWHYDYESNRDCLNKHWHILCGHDDSECKDTKYKVIQLMMDYFTQNEQYERCAELVKIVKNEKLDKNIQR